MTETPKLPRSSDGIYPRCVWCDGENYGPAVFAYSLGETPCAAAGGCGKTIPESYIGPRAEAPLSRKVERDFDEFIADRVGSSVGSGHLRAYDWAGDEDDDDPYPPLVVIDTKTGRRFEIEFEVTAHEIKPTT